MTNAVRDENHVTVALGVSSTSATTTLPFKIDPITGRLLVDSAGGGGSPGGNDTDIQFNDSSAFGGEDTFTFNKTTKTVTLGVEAGVGIFQAPTAVSADTDGGTLVILAGSGLGSGEGGQLDLESGAGNNSTGTGDGGELTITSGHSGHDAGNGGDVTITSGAGVSNTSSGGNINLEGGQSHGTGIGGDINLTAGSTGTAATGHAGSVNITAGNGATNNSEGSVNITGGNGTGTNAPGGPVNIYGGDGLGNQIGGFFNAGGGTGGATGNGGDAEIDGGQGGATSGNGGNIIISAGDAPTSGNGGSISLAPGSKGGAGSSGSVSIQDPASGIEAIFNTASLASTNKTFTFPNSSGTLALTSDIPAAGANAALSNLASVAINTALVLGTSDAAALGSATKQWSDLFLAEGGVINWDNGDLTITQTNNVLAIAGLTTMTVDGAITPLSNDGGALGAATVSFSDLFLAEGGVINWDNGDLTITQTNNVLAIAGLTTMTVDGAVTPLSNDGGALGSATVSWSDLFLASGALLNFANGNAVITHSSGIISVTTGELRITSANVGTNADSVPTLSSTSTLTNKTLTAPTLGGATSLADGATIKMIVPTVDGTATGPTTAAFVSGYSSSAVGDLVYLDSSGKWQKTDSDALATTTGLLGIALAVAATDAALLVALPGSIVYATAFPTLTIGAPYYVGETAGAIQSTIPTGADNAVRVVGFGVHADKLFFLPSSDTSTVVA